MPTHTTVSWHLSRENTGQTAAITEVSHVSLVGQDRHCQAGGSGLCPSAGRGFVTTIADWNASQLLLEETARSGTSACTRSS